MENSRVFFAPDPDDIYTGAENAKTDAGNAKEEIKAALPEEPEVEDKKPSSFKEALQQWSNDDAADIAFDDTRV